MVQYAQVDDAAAFRELYGRYAERVFGYLVKKLRQQQDAHVVFQETFLKLHAARHRYKSNFAFAPWLFTICHHALVDFKRRQKNHPVISADNLAAEVSEEPREIPKEVLAQLPKAQHLAVTMRFLDEKTFLEISEALGRSQGDVRQLVSRGVRRLRKILGGENHES